MRANWQLVPRGDILPQQAGLHITLNPKGHIALSRFTYQKMGEPAAFIILYDTANNRIGLKPSGAVFKNSYPALVANRHGSKRIYASRLLSEHRIDLPHTVRFFDADIDDQGILILDLRTAKPCPRSAGIKKSRNMPVKNTSVGGCD